YTLVCKRSEFSLLCFAKESPGPWADDLLRLPKRSCLPKRSSQRCARWQAGKDYDVRQVGKQQLMMDFVFYVVSKKAPNYDSAVYSPEGAASPYPPLLATPLSCRARTLSSWRNSLGFTMIYSTGADALSDVYGISRCKPVYQARSQANAEQSRPMIFAPILTVDFGFDGTHSVSANLTEGQSIVSAFFISTCSLTIVSIANKRSTWAKSEPSSVVYMSPGYVGCPFEGGSLYSSAMRNAKITDTFTLIADNFLNVNTSTTSLARHYEQGAFKVSISWKRTTPSSSWALQLDFGTKSGSGLSLFFAFIVVSMFTSIQ
ncbi:hypothetical protein PRIPAC_93965, partial [Pristionchus pacificus]|uniref:Uncharacterized protein n=1 Tax=Pristionchus pacificus TaxID=54126 RepID=A0A2A6CH50_PRIPA